jgi:hypothetical protein
MTFLRRLAVFIVLFVFMIVPLRASVHAQDEADDGTAAIQTTHTARQQDEETPAADDSSGDQNVDSSDSSGSGNPQPADIEVDGVAQTIAQGLAAFDAFAEGNWRITELEPRVMDEAPVVAADYFGFLYQMEGNTIVRNDITGKRARLEPGEAYFFSAGDKYVRYKDEGISRAWLVEVVPTNAKESDAPGDVIYTSQDPIGSFPDDTRDMELMAANLMTGDAADIANFEVDALLLVPVGTLDVITGDETTTMKAPSALLLTDEAQISNTSGEPAVYLVAKIGNSVGDYNGAVDGTLSTPDAASDDEEDAAGADAEATVDPMQDTDGDALIDTDEAVYGTDPNNPDTDGDGYDDYTEVVDYGTNPLDPNEWP